MGENNDIFLVGGDALLYLAGPMNKKYSFGAIHLVRMYLRTDFSIPQTPSPSSLTCKHMYALRVTVTAVGLFQKIILNTIAHMY